MSILDGVEQFSKNMMAQVDLRKEAYNLVKFQRNFENESNIIFPTPYLEFFNKSVLIESFEEGEPLSNYLHSKNPELKQINKKLANLGINAYMKMMLVDHFVHADLHPGNILVR